MWSVKKNRKGIDEMIGKNNYAKNLEIFDFYFLHFRIFSKSFALFYNKIYFKTEVLSLYFF